MVGLLTIVIGCVGVAVFIIGYIRYRKATGIDQVQASDLYNAADTGEPVFINGSVSVRQENTWRAPISQRGCLAFEYIIEYDKENQIPHTGIVSQDFLFSDGTHHALVESDGAEFDFVMDEIKQYNIDKLPEFVKPVYGNKELKYRNIELRMREGVLRQEDECSIVGEVESDYGPSSHEYRIIPYNGHLHVSKNKIISTRSELIESARLFALTGFVLIVVSVATHSII